MSLKVLSTEIPDVKLLVPTRHVDERGFLSEVYARDAFHDAGIACDFVQENHSYSKHAGTVRGLHFQIAPRAQGKLVRVIRGRVLDVAVDLRPDSPSFGRHVAVELSAEAWNQLYIPVGFAHGFCTLEPDTEVLYKLTDVYAPELERGLLWNDPALGIAWPVEPEQAILSPKDRALPRLVELTELVFT
jgi:dTDP-4-dehydrorhamnose 3,5-epimerase